MAVQQELSEGAVQVPVQPRQAAQLVTLTMGLPVDDSAYESVVAWGFSQSRKLARHAPEVHE
eukprot:354470-Chlamydomonas_euryale.AAC.38